MKNCEEGGMYDESMGQEVFKNITNDHVDKMQHVWIHFD